MVRYPIFGSWPGAGPVLPEVPNEPALQRKGEDAGANKFID